MFKQGPRNRLCWAPSAAPSPRGSAVHEVTSVGAQPLCGGQVISDSLIGFFDDDSRSKALGDKLLSFECGLMLL